MGQINDYIEQVGILGPNEQVTNDNGGDGVESQKRRDVIDKSGGSCLGCGDRVGLTLARGKMSTFYCLSGYCLCSIYQGILLTQ